MVKRVHIAPPGPGKRPQKEWQVVVEERPAVFVMANYIKER